MIGRRIPNSVKRGIGGIDANTLLMLHGEDFTDSSSNNIAFVNSNTTVVDGGRFGKCLNFNGNAYLRANNNSLFNFGAGDFTVDFWLSPNVAWNNNATGAIIGQKYSDSSFGWQIYNDNGTNIDARLAQQNNFFTTSAPTINTWAHWAFVRANGATRWFKNGILETTGTNTNVISDTSGYLYIGFGQTWSKYLNAKIDELRVSNIARWTTNFTPPTEPYSE